MGEEKERSRQAGEEVGGGGVRGGWLGGWRRGWVVSVQRGSGTGLITAHVKVKN